MARLPLAAHTFGFVSSHDPDAAIGAIAGLGFGAVQLMASPPHFDPWLADDARDKVIRDTLTRHNLPLLALDLASSDINLASAAPAVVAFAVEAYEQLIARAAELGASHICIGSGRRHALMSASEAQPYASFKEAFRRIRETGQRAGIALLLENHPQGLLASAPAMMRFLEEEGYDEIGIIYDVANAFAIGEDPPSGLDSVKQRLSLVHLSDSPKGGWRHDPIGSGDIAFDAIAAKLEQIGFAGPVVMEILSADPVGDLARGRVRLEEASFTFI